MKYCDALPFSATRTTNRGFSYIDKAMSVDTADKERKIYPDISYLDSGYYGTVGDLGNGRVVKYTLDAYEALAARRVMKLNCGCVPRVYSVRNIEKNIDMGGYLKKLYAIEYERVKLLNKFEREEYKKLFGRFRKFEVEDLSMGSEFLEFFRCLKGCGLSLNDAHSGNVGRNLDGKLVLLDLGGSFIRSFKWVHRTFGDS